VLSCRDVTEQASDYLDQAMPFWARMMFRLHLGMCRHCQELVRQLELTTAALGSGAFAPAPADGPDDALLAAFQSEFGPDGPEDSDH